MIDASCSWYWSEWYSCFSMRRWCVCHHRQGRTNWRGHWNDDMAVDSNVTIFLTRFAWWWQDLHAIELLRARIGERTVTRMLDYWRVMCFTGYRLNWNSWIWIPFPVDSDCALLCSQVDRTRYSSIASGNNCIVQLCKCVSLHLKWALWIHPVY
jgi:hypothetical protein